MFPTLAFRSELYSPDELFEGFDPTDPLSFAKTLDFRCFRSTKLELDGQVGMLRAMHDQCMTELRTELEVGRRVVAIMGGHGMARDDAAYREVAELARSLARVGILVVSGGGPGAMEATHLGAMVSPLPNDALDEALGRLSAEPKFPDVSRLVVRGGELDEGQLASLHRWQTPAFEVWNSIAPSDRGDSLAIPTWFYGNEPPTPFAGHIAKYFSNPLREDGLLAVAVDGVIYAPGRAGTVQEVFQDSAQNVYRSIGDRFSPMAFLNRDECWTKTLPVLPILKELFGPEEFERSVRVSEKPEEILAFLVGHHQVR